jgi:secondary thiamine-phosphate synthase enzyme
VSVAVYCDTVEAELGRGVDIKDVTEPLQRIVDASSVQHGSLHATVVGSTGSLTTIEMEPGVVEDLRRAIDRLAPPDIVYEHEKAWSDGNGHSHVGAAILGPCLALPVRNSRLTLGTWQQAVVVNHDVRARKRVVEVTVTGTAG